MFENCKEVRCDAPWKATGQGWVGSLPTLQMGAEAKQNRVPNVGARVINHKKREKEKNGIPSVQDKSNRNRNRLKLTCACESDLFSGSFFRRSLPWRKSDLKADRGRCRRTMESVRCALRLHLRRRGRTRKVCGAFPLQLLTLLQLHGNTATLLVCSGVTPKKLFFHILKFSVIHMKKERTNARR
ncbi:unnamed protein product [Victoria cruziana]